MSDIGDILIPKKVEQNDSWEWATVVQESPLRLRFDGETADVTIGPVDTVGGLLLNDRVLCQLHGKQFIALARKGGKAQDPSFDVQVTAPSFSASGDISAGGKTYSNTFYFPANDTKFEASSGSSHIGVLTSVGGAAPLKVGSLVISDSYLDSAATSGLWVKGSSTFKDRVNMDAQPFSLGIYNATSTFTANVGIATSPTGGLYRLTSSKRYKVAIHEEDIPDDAIKALVPKTYVDKKQHDDAKGKRGKKGRKVLPRYLGLIAEDVAEIPGLSELLVTYADIEGLGNVPDAVSYDRVGVALIPVIQRLMARVEELEKRLGI